MGEALRPLERLSTVGRRVGLTTPYSASEPGIEHSSNSTGSKKRRLSFLPEGRKNLLLCSDPRSSACSRCEIPPNVSKSQPSWSSDSNPANGTD